MAKEARMVMMVVEMVRTFMLSGLVVDEKSSEVVWVDGGKELG